MKTLRADMHVHTCHSRDNQDIPFLGARDCYSTPAAVYATARRRGMDLVAITDHDTVDGALELASRVDPATVIVGEEVSCWIPDCRIEVHLGVYEMTDALHRDLQPLRDNVFDVVARLTEAGVFFALNHLLYFYDTRLPLGEYLRLLDVVPALEVRNGTMVPAHNRLVEQVATQWPRPGALDRFAAVAGSDAHTLRRVGTTWTEAPGESREAFLASVRAGLGRPGGCDGGARAVSADAYGVIARFMASLAGLGPRDHRGMHRAICLAFSLGSLPFQFLPFAIIGRGKLREGRKVHAVRAQLTLNAPAPDVTPVAARGPGL